MADDLWNQAEQLANRNYSFIVMQDEYSTGGIAFVASNPDLPGCKSQGDTMDDALNNLDLARVDYIQMLLEEELEVPKPGAIWFGMKGSYAG